MGRLPADPVCTLAMPVVVASASARITGTQDSWPGLVSLTNRRCWRLSRCP